MYKNIMDLFHEKEGKFPKALVYCEFDDRKGPVVYGQYPVIYKNPEDLKRVAQFSMPVGQFEDESGFYCFSLDEETMGISCFLRISSLVRTLRGNGLSSLTWITELIFNPFSLKPVLEGLLLQFMRCVADSSLLKVIFESFNSRGRIDDRSKVKEITTPFSAIIPLPKDLPLLFSDFEHRIAKNKYNIFTEKLYKASII